MAEIWTLVGERGTTRTMSGLFTMARGTSLSSVRMRLVLTTISSRWVSFVTLIFDSILRFLGREDAHEDRTERVNAEKHSASRLTVLAICLRPCVSNDPVSGERSAV